MPKSAALTQPDPAALIVTIRRQRVILDADLAALYGVPTRALNQALKRNAQRFPETFAFQVTVAEWEAMRSQNVTASRRNARFLPWAFTEHGALMAANVLQSERAIQMSVELINAFIRLRQMALSVEDWPAKSRPSNAASASTVKTFRWSSTPCANSSIRRKSLASRSDSTRAESSVLKAIRHSPPIAQRLNEPESFFYKVVAGIVREFPTARKKISSWLKHRIEEIRGEAPHAPPPADGATPKPD